MSEPLHAENVIQLALARKPSPSAHVGRIWYPENNAHVIEIRLVQLYSLI